MSIKLTAILHGLLTLALVFLVNEILDFIKWYKNQKNKGTTRKTIFQSYLIYTRKGRVESQESVRKNTIHKG